MGRFLNMFLLICVIMGATAQLTFTPTWGKRGLGQPGAGGQPEQGCKASVDSLMLIYKLIQVSTKTFLSYEHFGLSYLYFPQQNRTLKRSEEK